MKKLNYSECELTFHYKSEKYLRKQIDELHRERFNEADFRKYFIEADFYDKIND